MSIVVGTVQFKRATAARWAEANPVLLAGEPGWDLDNGAFKIGDGSNPWNNLGFIAPFRYLAVQDISGTSFPHTITDPLFADLYIINKSTPVTINLCAASNSGRPLRFKSIGAGSVTIAAHAGNTIDGEASQVINQWECLHIVDYSVGWYIL